MNLLSKKVMGKSMFAPLRLIILTSCYFFNLVGLEGEMGKLCPCHSAKLYWECCRPYHEGIPAENALKLMRSRYSGYALKKLDYINDTAFQKRDIKDLRASYQNTQFTGLDILEFINGVDLAFVTFKAILKQDGHDISFTEKSEFKKINNRWIYTSGVRLN